MRAMLPEFENIALPVIGMLHLPPLPGSPCYAGDPARVEEAMLADAAALVEGGVHALMLENFGDAPFFPNRVPAETLTHMTALAARLRERFSLPLGINVLRNDGCGALAVAHAAGASFIRVNILCGARITDQGIIEGIAHDLLRERVRLGAKDIRIMADVDVKHSAPLGIARPLMDEVRDLVHRGRADAIIVSGWATGQAVNPQDLQTVRSAAGDTPVFIGSGVAEDNVRALASHAQGVIVGSAFKHDGRADQRVDPARVRTFMQAVAAMHR